MSKETHMSQPARAGVAGVKRLVAVASGKGGVGKSTTAVNLALALQAQGQRVGLLDADIHGPNQPAMLGVTELPKRTEAGLEPVSVRGLQTMSMGYIIDAETPMVWRGPMVSKVMEQLLRETSWKQLDTLIIDLPPGTGDVALTLAKRFKVAGAVMVTTPQEVALLDTQKSIAMFHKVELPVLGVIENMSLHVCSKCGHKEAVFGVGGGDRLAADASVPLLGRLPLDVSIREAGDAGLPIVLAQPDSDVTQCYRDIALALMRVLDGRKKTAFPDIIVE